MQEFLITIQPRFYETDALGHINNASIAAWFEVLRTSFLDSLGETNPADAMGWILASVQIDFKAEIFYGCDVTAVITEAVVGNSSLTMTCRMSQRDVTTVTGRAVLVRMDSDTKKPMRIPDGLRAEIEAL